jgi:nickel-dependent lactate racemase
MYKIPYGSSQEEFSLSEGYKVDFIFPQTIPAQANIVLCIKNALLHPIDKIDESSFNKGKKVAIAINDPTRPVPHSILLPPLIEFLEDRGINKEDIFFFIATGTHKPVRKDELFQILPVSIIDHYQIQSHDCDNTENMKFFGTTSRNTPVFINRRFCELDIKILVGNIEPHHYMGFSGGTKTAAIGLAGRDTINKNHSLLLDPLSYIGNYETNPTRQDVEEIGDMLGITAALNVVMNSEKNIVNVFWGTPRNVMNAGIPVSRQVCQKKIENRYDLVIASPGGYPKDINLYQAQKAITHVNLIAKEKGTIILVAECREGLGSKLFEEYLSNFSTFFEVIDHFKKIEFKVGPHKAYQLALQGVKNRLILVSSMDNQTVQMTLLEHARSVDEAINLAEAESKPNLSVAIVPFATNTVLY